MNLVCPFCRNSIKAFQQKYMRKNVDDYSCIDCQPLKGYVGYSAVLDQSVPIAEFIYLDTYSVFHDFILCKTSIYREVPSYGVGINLLVCQFSDIFELPYDHTQLREKLRVYTIFS
jgi:hypothetical protein